MRRAAQGKLSEAFGSGQLRHDKLMRSIGLIEASQASLETLSQDVRDGLKAFSNGINDYVDGIGVSFGGNSGHIMPLEFFAFSVEWEPWTEMDSLTIMRLTSLMMSFSFTVDIVRETLRYVPEIEPFIDELLPFRSDFQSSNQYTAVDDESLKEFG